MIRKSPARSGAVSFKADMEVHASGVGVFVRVRPTTDFAQELIECLPDEKKVNIYQRTEGRKPAVSNQQTSWSFHLDGVLQDVPQEEVYTNVARRVVLGALDGYNGTVMCFGQTGSGKSYTMTGSTESFKQRGIIPRALQEVFQEVEKRSEQVFSVHLSYLEIYNENMVDLLSSVLGTTPLSARGMVVTEEPGRGVFIRGLSLHPVRNEEDALNLLFEGEMNRIIGSHALNRNSSRSHCIFTLHIECRSRAMSDAKYVTSKLNLVDLAGSERVGKTGSEGRVLKEAMYINKSLSFLEQAILALADHRRDHVPIRQTKLTHALKDSLGGNTNTVLVANIYGEEAQVEETLSTLRFASRMKRVKSDPAVNQHVDPIAQIKKLQKEVELLKEELSLSYTVAGAVFESQSEAQLAEIQCQVQQYLDGNLKEISILSVGQIQAVFAQFKLIVQELEQKTKAQPSQSLAGKKTLKDSKGRSVDAAAEAQTQGRQSPGKGKSVRFKEKQSTSKKRGGSPVSPKPVDSKSKASERKTDSPAPDSSQDLDRLESQPTSPEPPRISAPPKADAFEDFKSGQGSELNRILGENKVVLRERQARLRNLTELVNAIKKEIDCTTASIQQFKNLRSLHGQFVGLDGEPLHEPDVALVMHLRKLKDRYQQKYAALCSTKAETNYCLHLVDQCRVRLLSEFQDWYQEVCPEVEMDKVITQEKDDQQLPSDLGECLGAVSFYNARQNSLERRNRGTVHSVSSVGSRQ
ncbi:kinesin-like protein KIF9 [Genypterus blacodes]|uniref:kinesin-like protein KIF9 n=1 Tax=Genypterus blacodes TaxID=154954 RepID=UPI003F75BD38